MLRNNNYHKDNKKPYRTSSTTDIQQRDEQTSAFLDSFPQDIKSIITKLRITIDHIDSPRNYARDLIHELARQLDERRLCARGRISIKIKERQARLLKDGSGNAYHLNTRGNISKTKGN